MSDFKGSIVLITGASGGLGRALCGHFADLGAKIIALDRDARVHDLAGAECAVVDVSDPEAVAETIRKLTERTGPVDVLVNNAAIGGAERTVAKSTVAGWEETVAIDLHSVFYCTKAVLPAMQDRQRGSIVMVASVNGLTTLGSPAYSASKAAMLSFTKSVAVEYGRHGIRANAVCPGTIRTPIWQQRLDGNPHLFEQLAKWYPLGRIAEPIEVARAVAFLASEDASFITGAILNVDGGLMAGNAVMASELTVEKY
ncbi:SDR family oxidoreductase [Chelativorans sp. AA-79]|uniref:SDR family oxidoreductase n=1 Tax=Chelativorans sp. AA-79 TaxID=3028735 RepID=UPI0023F910EE|nr:SDR family oxidoreductase [Chelativorans sp. AA-79]WEX12424.1 SDR family oxidoreductase [Chelativorans sp. AA-79]